MWICRPPKPHYSHVKMSWYLVQSWIQCNFRLFWPKFRYHGNSLSSLEDSDIIFWFVDPENLLFTRKMSRYLVEISAILAFFGLNLVAMATALASLKIQIAYLNSPTSKILLFKRKMCWRLVQSWNQCIFGLFLPKFGCHGNSLCSLENADSILVSADHENPTIHAKSVSIWCTELKLVRLWLIFARIWLPWQPPLLPWKFR